MPRAVQELLPWRRSQEQRGDPAQDSAPTNSPTIPDHGRQSQVLVLGDTEGTASSKPGAGSAQGTQSGASRNRIRDETRVKATAQG